VSINKTRILPCIHYSKANLEEARKEILFGIKHHKEYAQNWLYHRYPNVSWDKVIDFKFEFTDYEYIKFREMAQKKNLDPNLVASLDVNYDVSYWLTYTSIKLCGRDWRGAIGGMCWVAGIINYIYTCCLIIASENDNGSKKLYTTSVRALLNPYMVWPQRAVVRLGIKKEDRNE